MKDIVFVVTAMGRGGAERVISILSDDYAKRGFRVHIVMLWHNIVEYELNPNVHVVDLSCEKKSLPMNMLRLVGALRKLIKELRPVAVVSFVAHNSVVTWLARMGLKTRFVASERIDPSSTKRGSLLRAAINAAYAGSTVTVQQTERALRYFPNRVQKKSVIIPNPVRVLAEADGSAKRIVTAGRLEPEKNQKMLIRAFADVHRDHPDWRLDIYGEGRLREELQGLIDELHLTSCVGLPGVSPTLHEEIRDASLFVLPSNSEGLSNALLEAMMMGLPCISTNCAGSDEAIVDGENGRLISVGDTDALARVLRELVEDPDRRTAIGRAAKESADRYRVENVIAEWRKVIEGEEEVCR
ncbi:MAG: glycosyltransferase family 4 protein [Clostridia bacterium]|nr:glycosyltransferase family 4 protein [Clostridia bacterium]